MTAQPIASLVGALCLAGCTALDMNTDSIVSAEDGGAHPELARVLEEAAAAHAAPGGTTDSARRAGDDVSSVQGFVDNLEVMHVLTVPAAALWEAARTVVVEDYDTAFRPTTYTAFVVDDDGEGPISATDPFTIRLKYLAVDNLVEGRLRDSWGGVGGELSLLASVNALAPSGKLLREDRAFLATTAKKRRSWVLAALGSTDKGREQLEKLEGNARKFVQTRDEWRGEYETWKTEFRDRAAQLDALELTDSGRVDELIDSFETYLFEKIRDDLDGEAAEYAREFAAAMTRGIRARGSAAAADRQSLTSELRGWTRGAVHAALQSLRGRGVEIDAETADSVQRVVAASIDERVAAIVDATGASVSEEDVKILLEAELERQREQIVAGLRSHGLDLSGDLGTIAGATIGDLVDSAVQRLTPRVTVAVQRIHGWVGAASASIETATENIDPLVEMASRIGVDDDGIFESVTVIEGLAEADRTYGRDFLNVRPSKWTGDTVGTAALLYPPPGDSSAVRYAHGGDVVFHGTLDELMDDHEVAGFSLSVLMLERDSDELVRALQLVNQYAQAPDTASDATLDAVLDAVLIIADKIAEDDVELKSVDLRFLAQSLATATTGTRAFELRPCKVVVGRNFYDRGDFGAVAVIEIAR